MGIKDTKSECVVLVTVDAYILSTVCTFDSMEEELVFLQVVVFL